MLTDRRYFRVSAFLENGNEQYHSGTKRFTGEPVYVSVLGQGEEPKQEYELTPAQWEEIRNDKRIRWEPADPPDLTTLGPKPVTPENAHIYQAKAEATAKGELVVERDAEGKSAMDRQHEAWMQEQAAMQGKTTPAMPPPAPTAAPQAPAEGQESPTTSSRTRR